MRTPPRVEGAAFAAVIAWKQAWRGIVCMSQLVYLGLFRTPYSATMSLSIVVFAWLRQVSGAAFSGLASAPDVPLVCSSPHAYR